MTPEQELQVDAYILAASNLRTTTRGYKALQLLLEHGNLLYCYLGKWDTLDLMKLLIHLKFDYEFRTGGIQLHENSKSDFYHNLMDRKVQVRTTYNQSSTRIGKEERSEYGGWIRTREEKKD